MNIPLRQACSTGPKVSILERVECFFVQLMLRKRSCVFTVNGPGGLALVVILHNAADHYGYISTHTCNLHG